MTDALVQDVRYAARTLKKSPGVAAVAVATLALGIGANSAIFSFVDGALLKRLPYPRPDRLMVLWERPPDGDRNVISALNVLDWQSENTVFESLAANAGVQMTLSGGTEPVLLRGARGSASYFDVFGIKPALGRTFAPDEDQPGKDHVVVLSHALWASRFGSDPSILGRSLILDGEPFVVIGVMPRDAPFDRGWSQLWRPLAFRPSERTRDFHWLEAMGRLKSGVTIDQARAEMTAIAARLALDHPDSNRGWGITVDRFEDTLVGPELRQSLLVLVAAVGMLLLIGCANLANLMLARGSSREREIAVRAALGAGQRRLLRQLLAESVGLAGIGGIAGVGVGYLMLKALRILLPPFTLPRDVTVAMDARVLGFTAVLSLATGILFGLVPALDATKTDLVAAMKEGGRGSAGESARAHLRSVFIVVEVALAFVLLVGGALLVRSFFDLMSVPLGFDGANVLTLRLPIPSSRFADVTELSSYVRQLIDTIAAVPGVQAAAAADALPLEGWNNGMPFRIAGRPAVDPANRPDTGFKMVDPEYFRLLGIRVVRGRALTDRDANGALPVAVVNQSFADRFFHDGNPIGERLLIEQIVAGSPKLGPEIPWEIVGVIADERVGLGRSGRRPGVYVSLSQSPTTYINAVVRTKIEPAAAARAITGAVLRLSAGQAVTDVRTIEQIKRDSLGSNRLRTVLLAAFAGLAVGLAAVGVYGVLSYAVAQRKRELGVRAALGATPRDLTRLVIVNGMTLIAVGLTVGAAAAFALAGVLRSLLVGVGAHDPLTFVGAAAVLIAVGFVSCWVPARRAATLDPLVALRD